MPPQSVSIQQLCTLFNLAGIGIVLLAALTVLRRPKPLFFTLWVRGFACTSWVVALELVASSLGRPVWLVLAQVVSLGAGAWFFYSSGRSLKGDPPALATLGWLLAAALGLESALLGYGVAHQIVSLPMVVLNSAAYAYLGWSLLGHARATPADVQSVRWLGWPQIALGLWIFTYPAFVDTPWFWLGFFVAAVLNIFVGVGMVIFLLEEATTGLEARNQELVLAVQHKQTFLSIVSHELRTPLASIMGYQELLEDEVGGPLQPKQREYLAQMQQGQQQLSTLIDSLLDTYQLESGGLRVAPEPMDVANAVHAALGPLQALLTGKALELAVTIPEDRPLVHADPQRIVQVLNNLIANAAKFTEPQGRVAITVTPQEGFIEVAVSDSGIGMPKDQLAHVFEPFYQIDTSLTRRYGGTGLGLSIVRELVTRMGGQVGVESEEGAGSRFWFTLPVMSGTTAPKKNATFTGNPESGVLSGSQLRDSNS